MDNEYLNIPELIKKYEQMRYINKAFYFDADEFTIITNHYIQKKNTLEAERAVDLGLSMHQDNSQLMIAKAKVLVASKKYEEAYNYLLSIAEDETNVDLLLLKFECLIKLNRTIEANPFLEYILKGDLNEEDYYTFVKEVGYLYNDAEIFETAMMLLEKAMKVDNTNMDVLVELAYAYEMSDNIDKAIDITNAIIDLNPYSFDAWVSLGRLYMYNFEYDLSIEAYDFALAIKESDVNVLKLKAITHSENFNYEEELKVLNECIDASPDDESLYDDLLQKYKEFEEYWGLEQDEGILKVLEKKEAKFGPKGLLLKMAHHNLRLAQVDEAQEIFTRIAEEDKNTIDYYMIEGDLALHTKDYVAAEAAYMKAYNESPTDVEILDRLADVNMELDNYEKSADYIEQLIAVDPEYSIMQFRLAHIRFQIGEKEPFEEIINKISDKEELGLLLSMFSPFVIKEKREKREKIDYTKFSRQELLMRLSEALESKEQLKKQNSEIRDNND